MRRGAVKPGYIIVSILIVAAVSIPYAVGKSRVSDENKTLQKIYSYGDKVISYIRDKNSTKLQSEIMIDGHRMDLEDVALFLETVNMESTQGSNKWEGYKTKDNNITIFGSIKGKSNSKRVDMMLIKRGDKLLVKAIHIGDKGLESSKKGFPLDSMGIDDLGDMNGSSLEVKSER